MKLYESKFKDAVIAITYACNSRCQMCNIWQYKGPAPLAVEEYKKIPSTLTSVNISGGESFLRPDIALVMKTIKDRAPKAKFKISTNGFSAGLTKKRMLEILEVVDPKWIGVVLSIDGYKEKQDEFRGIPDGYNKIMETLKMLREIGIKDITIATTIGDYNVDHLLKMYEVSLELKTQFTVAIVHNSEHYFQIESNKITHLLEVEKAFTELYKRELKTWNIKRWLRAFFAAGIVYYVKNQKRLLPNYGGQKAFFMDPNGFVYSSDVAPKPMGNIKDFESFQAMLDTPEAQEAAIKESKSSNWMICTSRTAIQTHPFRVIFWIIKNKFLGWG